MESTLSIFSKIMFFYIIITYCVFPVAFYYLGNKKSFIHAGYGFVLGSIISVILWILVGQQKIK